MSEQKDDKATVTTTIFFQRSGETVEVEAQRKHGRLVFQGDILLPEPAEGATEIMLEAAAVALPGALWHNGTIPYEIQAPDLAAIQQAIALWNAATVIRLTPRNGEVDHVVFVTASTFSLSPVGRQGGRQEIFVAPGASFGEVAHEIGHAVGLWHEHSRNDRDPFIDVNLSNVAIADRPNFRKVGNDAENLTPYDYDSIMHYGAFDFALDPAQPTIVQKQPGPPIGQRDHLSVSDREAVAKLYA